eukprot:comp43321_c0_seq1/m.47471 comp43321_c0_seq1/g.47471  ORF comp43321_c0_seq1/g.47471 comp43321_c0_seq1/m.47471 type:complete len:295 (-) comp43321_c0_seq1:457-1341(-)
MFDTFFKRRASFHKRPSQQQPAVPMMMSMQQHAKRPNPKTMAMRSSSNLLVPSQSQTYIGKPHMQQQTMCIPSQDRLSVPIQTTIGSGLRRQSSMIVRSPTSHKPSNQMPSPQPMKPIPQPTHMQQRRSPQKMPSYHPGAANVTSVPMQTQNQIPIPTMRLTPRIITDLEQHELQNQQRQHMVVTSEGMVSNRGGVKVARAPLTQAYAYEWEKAGPEDEYEVIAVRRQPRRSSQPVPSFVDGDVMEGVAQTQRRASVPAHAHVAERRASGGARLTAENLKLVPIARTRSSDAFW